MLFNVNTPADLAKAERLLNRTGRFSRREDSQAARGTQASVTGSPTATAPGSSTEQ